MKKLFTRLLKISPLLSLIPVSTSCGSSQIVFANYESYMSDDVMTSLHNKHNVSFLPYETNEDIENKFKHYYDAAIPSTYEVIQLYKKGWLDQYDWSKFQIKKTDGTYVQNGTDALNSGIFSDSVTTLIKALDKEYFPNPQKGEPKTLLDIGIPYFLQSFSFAYKGDSISALDNANSWSDIFNTISSYNNPDPRFTPSNERKIAVVDDSRSVFGICNSMSYDSVNPNEQTQSIDDFKKIYQNFSTKFKKGYTYFNTDSGQVISTLCKRYPEGASSAIAYNGDLLYAAQGGGLYNPADDGQFHFCELDNTLIALDMVVINKKNANNQKKLNEVYDIVKDVCLSGTSSDEQIDEQNFDGSYKYDSVNNFSFVQYTSPLEKICDYVMNGDYFDTNTYSQSQIELFKQIYNIELDESDVKYVEERIESDLVKSNMHWAYSSMKMDL